MFLAEYSEDEKLALVRDNAYREGWEAGRAESTLDTLISLVNDGLLSVKDAADQAGLSESAFNQKMMARS